MDEKPQDNASTSRQSSDDDHAAKSIKQGGTLAWLQVVGGFLVFFNIWGFPLSFGIFQSFYTLQYLDGYSPSAISWIGTFQNFLVVIIGMFGGPLYDLGYYPVQMAVGAFLNVFGIMMISLSTQYYQLFLSHACNGVGGGLMYVATLTVVAQSHGKTRAMAMGIMASGIALGGVIYTIVFLKLQPGALGFGWTVRVMGFLALATYLVAIPTLFMGPRQGRGGRARALIDKTAFKDLKFAVFAVGQMFGFWGYLPPVFYLTTYAQVRLGTGEATSFWLLVATQAASLFGRLGAATAAHYLGVMLPWVLCVTVSGVLCLVWTAIDDLGGFATFCVLFGFFSGALIALPPSIFPVVSPRREVMGTRLGMSWAVTSIASLSGGPIAGALVKLDQADFLGMQVWSGVVLLVAGGIVALLWFLLARQHQRILL